MRDMPNESQHDRFVDRIQRGAEESIEPGATEIIKMLEEQRARLVELQQAV